MHVCVGCGCVRAAMNVTVTLGPKFSLHVVASYEQF